MKSITAIILLATIAFSQVARADTSVTTVAGSRGHREPHSSCYLYFFRKDHCVSNAQRSRERCHFAKATASEVMMVQEKPRSLERRYTTSPKAPTLDKVVHHCDPPNGQTSWGKSQLGVYVWAGSGQGKNSGWLDTLTIDGRRMYKNCGKEVYIQRSGPGGPKTVQYARVIGSVSFREQTANDVGCFNIAVNQNLFRAFKPNATEKKAKRLLTQLVWDWNNPDGKNPEDGPN